MYRRKQWLFTPDFKGVNTTSRVEAPERIVQVNVEKLSEKVKKQESLRGKRLALRASGKGRDYQRYLMQITLTHF